MACGGALGERGNWFLGGSYFRQDPVFSRDRERTRVPVFGTGNLLGSSRVPGGRFIFVDPDGNEYDLTTNAGLNDPTYTPGLPDCASGVPRTDGFHCFGAEDAFNYAPYNLVLSPSERSGIFGQVRFDLGENVRAYGRALANRRESQNQAAPEPIDLGPGAGTTYAANVFIPASNPYNPFGFDLSTGPDGNIITIRRRPTEGGPRIFDQTVDTQFVGGGLEGSFGDTQQWFWDVNVAWSRNEAEQENRGSYNSLRIQQALDPAVCATTNGCVLLDIFGFDTMTPEMIQWISPVFRDRSEQTLTQATVNFGGELFELPAGPLAFASGYEYRKYEGEYDPDPATVRGEYNGVPSLPTRGEYDVNEVYVELSVPLLKDSVFGKALDLSLAGRYSDYSTFGGEFTPKYGLRWQVVDELLLRTTYAEGFRAPSIGELFGQPSRFDANIVDPCLGANYAANAANCTALGVAPGTPQFDPQIGVETGGNPDLEPERSRSFSAGVVWTPSLLEDSAIARRVDFAATYYRHDIQGAIQAPDPQTQLDLCVQTLDPTYCDGIVRNATTDQIESFANYLTNFTSIQTSGWDFDVYWTLPESAAGDLKLTWLNTWVTDYTAAGADGTQQPLQPGRLVSDPVTRSIPEWTSSLSLDWTRGNLSASWTARHLSQLVEQCGDATGLPACTDTPAAGQNRLGSTTFHDVQFAYRFDWLKGLQVAVGANNVFGKEPPICLSCNLNSFDGSTYDLPGGGYYYVRADLRF